MAYADYSFYVAEYVGNAVTEAEWPLYSARAYRQLDLCLHKGWILFQPLCKHKSSWRYARKRTTSPIWASTSRLQAAQAQASRWAMFR